MQSGVISSQSNMNMVWWE